MTKKNESSALDAIGKQRFLPLFYHDDLAVCMQVVKTLYMAGVRVIEFTNRGDNALKNFRALKKNASGEMTDLFLGVGTIKNKKEAKDFIKAGANFIVCPVVDETIGEATHAAGLLWIPGCMTPTEINRAYQYSAKLIKVFPGNLVGPSYFTALKEIFPGQRFLPSGGVDLTEANLSDWFNAGAFAVGLGSKLVSKKLMDDQDYDQIADNVSKATTLIKSIS